MPIAGAVVVPLRKEGEGVVLRKLNSYKEVEVKDPGDKGIAVVLEADEVRRLKEVSEEIAGWEEVVEFNLAYLNWEDEGEKNVKHENGGGEA